MNLYMLVEGRRTEMIVYPAWIAHLLPFLTQVEQPFQAWEDNFYVISGFGYPNLLHHIENCVKDVNHFKRFDYLVICLDSDDTTASDRIKEIEGILNKEGLWPIKAKIKVLVQTKCIETWFLGSDLNQKGKMTEHLKYYLNSYNVFKKDPEKMEKPKDYRGSIGDFHCNYLCRLLEANGALYTKRRPFYVCSEHYINSLKHRVKRTGHMDTLANFFSFCGELKVRHREEESVKNALDEERLCAVIDEQKEG